jgi:hypothetical protein
LMPEAGAGKRKRGPVQKVMLIGVIVVTYAVLFFSGHVGRIVAMVELGAILVVGWAVWAAKSAGGK